MVEEPTLGQMDELVGTWSDDGTWLADVPRERVRAHNLLHRATGVVVRDPSGRLLVHRRTQTKDVYPGLWDCCAGGVVQAGEDPRDAAARELAEEVGVTGVPLEPLGRARYEDDVTRYDAFLFAATWDGPVRAQPEEVAWLGWMAPVEVADLLADPQRPFVPDTRALLASWWPRFLGALP